MCIFLTALTLRFSLVQLSPQCLILKYHQTYTGPLNCSRLHYMIAQAANAVWLVVAVRHTSWGLSFTNFSVIWKQEVAFRTIFTRKKDDSSYTWTLAAMRFITVQSHSIYNFNATLSEPNTLMSRADTCRSICRKTDTAQGKYIKDKADFSPLCLCNRTNVEHHSLIHHSNVIILTLPWSLTIYQRSISPIYYQSVQGQTMAIAVCSNSWAHRRRDRFPSPGGLCM